jgi:phosphoglycerate dehydrogenase-like enzyme
MIPHVVVDTGAGLDLDRVREDLDALDATVSVQNLDTESAVMTAAIDAEAVVLDDPSVFSDHSLTSMPDLDVVVVAGATAAGLDLDAAGWAGITVLAVPLDGVEDPGERAAAVCEQLRLALGDGEPTTVVE